jgi:hypothetical protein
LKVKGRVFGRENAMTARQKTDSQQERALQRKDDMWEAIRASQGKYKEVVATTLERGMYIVTSMNRTGKVVGAEKVNKIEWSRRGEWCKVNDRYVYSYGGFAEVLYTADELKAIQGRHNLADVDINHNSGQAARLINAVAAATADLQRRYGRAAVITD